MYKSFFSAMMLCGGWILLVGCSGGPGDREFRSGIREYERGSYVRAKAQLEKSINERPGNPANADAYAYLGLAEWKLGQLQRAMEAFEYSRSLNPKLVEPTYNLAVILYESGDLDHAATLLDEVASANPSDSRSLEMLGSIYAQAGKWLESRRVLVGAMARSPQSPRILTALAVAEAHVRGADIAIIYLMQALEKKADYAPALFDLGVIYLQEMKDKAQAAAYFRKYLDVAENDPHKDYAKRLLEDLTGISSAPVSVVSVATVDVPRIQRSAVPPAAVPSAEGRPFDYLLASAKQESEKGNVQAALNLCLEAAGKANRVGETALQEKALREGVKLCFDQPRAHYALGRFLYDRGQYEAALKAFKQAIVLDPKFTMGQLGLAEAAVKTDEVDAALVALKQAIQLEPGNPDALWSLATLYDHELQNKDKASQVYRQFADRFPGDPRVIKAQERLNEFSPPPVRRPPAAAPVVPSVKAPDASPAPRPATSVTGALRIKPTMVRNTHAAVQAYNRGTLYQQQDDLDRAIYFYTRAVENDDTFATAFFNLGSVYWTKGEYAMAKDAFGRAVQLQPDMIAARYNLALIHRELKERSAAMEQLSLLLKSHPEYAPGHYLLGMLYAEDPAAAARAKEQYKAFLDLAPNDPAAPVVQKWMQTH